MKDRAPLSDQRNIVKHKRDNDRTFNRGYKPIVSATMMILACKHISHLGD